MSYLAKKTLLTKLTPMLVIKLAKTGAMQGRCALHELSWQCKVCPYWQHLLSLYSTDLANAQMAKSKAVLQSFHAGQSTMKGQALPRNACWILSCLFSESAGMPILPFSEPRSPATHRAHSGVCV